MQETKRTRGRPPLARPLERGLHLRLAKEDYERLRAFAAAAGLKPSAAARELVNKGLDELEQKRPELCKWRD